MNVLLVSASIEGASHAYLHLSMVGKSLLHILWEYGLYDGLHTCYTSVIASLKGWQGKISACGVFLQVAASKCLKTAKIVFIPIGDCIFLPTKEVRYTPRSCRFSRLEPGANGLNAHARIIYSTNFLICLS